MPRRAALAAALVALISLGGCSWFSSDDNKEAEAQAATAVERRVPVEAVRSIEIGRTRDGIAVTAHGLAPGLGYGASELRPRRDGTPDPEGLLDFDFVAVPPDPGFDLGTGSVQARAVRADILLSPRDIEGVRGIRIHAASGGMQMMF